MKYIIANWKAHFTSDEAIAWCKRFTEKLSNGNAVQTSLSEDKLRIIIAPPYPLIPYVKQHLPQMKNIYVGAQDISRYDAGNYTGDVTAHTLSGLVHYCIVGHSERRLYYKESPEEIEAKIIHLSKCAIEPILCVRGVNDPTGQFTQYIAYEPVESIGTGHNASTELVVRVRQAMRISQPKIYLYGGSVDPQTCKQYLQHPQIDGVLVGSASLDADAFYSIITQA